MFVYVSLRVTRETGEGMSSALRRGAEGVAVFLTATVACLDTSLYDSSTCH